MKRPLFMIGVSGHQNLGNAATQDFVAHHFRELLSRYQHQYGHLILYSSLALGADQLFARIALEQGVTVEAVLPCSSYETTFHSKDERDGYQQLLHACQRTHLLPNQECSEDAFLAAGQWIVDHSDIMILAWNGLPPRGKGGTGDLPPYAQLRGRPFIHLHTLQHQVKYYADVSPQTTSPSHIDPKQSFHDDQKSLS